MAGAAAAVTVWDQRVFARDVRRQNAEMLLAAPTHGAKRIAACCTQMLEPLELRGHLLHASGPNPPTLEEHLTVARPVLDVCSAAVQLLLGLPAASTSRPGAGAELLRLLSTLLGSFTLGANLPTGCGASQAQPQAAAAMLHLVVSRSLLPRLLLLLRREVGQPAWHANALLGSAVALSWALSLIHI